MSSILRVIIVDDHPVTLEGLRDFLNLVGDIEVIGIAGSGSAALELVASSQPDVVLLDCRLPDIPGEDVAAQIRRLGLSTRVLAFSGYDDEEHVAAMLAAGVKGYLLKTEPPEVILEAVRAVGRGESRFSPRIVEQVIGHGYALANPPNLSEREIDVLKLLVQGEGNKEIAHKLGITVRTVEFHLTNIYLKMGVSLRVQAALQAQKLGLIS